MNVCWWSGGSGNIRADVLVAGPKEEHCFLCSVEMECLFYFNVIYAKIFIFQCLFVNVYEAHGNLII